MFKEQRSWSSQLVLQTMLSPESVDASAPDSLGSAPVLGQDRPKRLIQVLTVTQERSSQDTLLYGAHLAERPVAPSVGHSGARLEPVHTD
jgi:hypothetical protein